MLIPISLLFRYTPWPFAFYLFANYREPKHMLKASKTQPTLQVGKSCTMFSRRGMRYY